MKCTQNIPFTETVFKTYPENAHVSAQISSGDLMIVKRAAFKSSLMSGTILLAFSTHEINQNTKEIQPHLYW